MTLYLPGTFPSVKVRSSSAFDGFGLLQAAATADTSDAFDPFGFGGQQGYYRDYSGLYFLTHRYYDAGAGRFVTRDPIGYKGGINLYGFAGNNPVNRVDPEGTDDNRSWLQRAGDWIENHNLFYKPIHGVRGIGATNPSYEGLEDLDGINNVPEYNLPQNSGQLRQREKDVTVTVAAGVLGAPTGGLGKEAEAAETAAPGLIAGTRGLAHSFSEHSAQWFGREVRSTTHMSQWQSLIEKAAQSHLRFPWVSGSDRTVAHLARIDGKWFMVQFFKQGDRAGELATAFVPGARQLSRMPRNGGH